MHLHLHLLTFGLAPFCMHTHTHTYTHVHRAHTLDTTDVAGCQSCWGAGLNGSYAVADLQSIQLLMSQHHSMIREGVNHCCTVRASRLKPWYSRTGRTFVMHLLDGLSHITTHTTVCSRNRLCCHKQRQSTAVFLYIQALRHVLLNCNQQPLPASVRT